MPSKLLDTSHNDARRMSPDTRQYVTVDKIKNLLPKKTNIAVTEEVVELINRMGDDTNLPQELLEEDVMSYTHLLGGMRGVGLKDLVNAVKYCNLRRNYGNKEAWSIVFPEKYNALVEANKQIDNHVSMYTSSKLVVAIDKEMLIPIHLQYAPYFHAAVKKQFDLMNGNASKDTKGNDMNVSPMVQHLAAKELANLTRQPEEQKLAVTVAPSDAALGLQSDMNDQLKQIVAHQKRQLEDGADILDVQVLGIDFSEVGKGNE